MTCDDCSSTGFYQPLMGPRESCRTCSVVSKQELARRAVALEQTAPPGDVLVGPPEGRLWKRRHPVVGTPPSEHQADCLCGACEDVRRLEYLKHGGPVTTRFVRNTNIWTRTLWADGLVKEVDEGVAATSENLALYQVSDTFHADFAIERACKHITERVRVWSTIGVIVRWCEVCGAVQQNEKSWEHPEK